MRKYVPGYLFARPSMLGGFAQIMDLGGTLQDYNYSSTDNEADFKAIANDWYAIGDDIRASIKVHEQKLKLTA